MSASLLLLAASVAPVQLATTPVATLDLAQMTQDWGKPQANRSVEGNPLRVNGQEFASGVGTHANSAFEIELGGSARRFEAMVGVDDEVGQPGTVEFEVWLDGKKAWSSGVMRSKQPAKRVSLGLGGKKLMTLLVTDAGDGISYDHANWAEAVITHRPGRAPKALMAEVEPTMAIASHRLNPAPRVNGPRVVGCTPGRPFVFRVPVSGQRPIDITIANLPAGLRLRNGVLSGRVAVAGEHRVVVRARNAHGSTERELTIVAGKGKLALTPPLGWNSWNVWGLSVTADRVRDAAQSMVDSGLADYGFQYVNIDDGWEATRGPDGVLPTNEKFGDMKLLANEVHALGLKLGIYSSPGPKTCGGFEGSYKHEHIDARTWAEWGIDYLKYDWCSFGGTEEAKAPNALKDPYLLMRDALDKADRDIVYSLCQYGMGEVWKWGNEVGGDLWRTTGDITDTWGSLSGIGFPQADISHYSGPSGWNDPDMLIVGYVGWSDNIRPTNLTQNQQITHITMWSMLAAPMLLGCDLTRLDDFTKDLLMNPEVLDVNQDPLGRAGQRVSGQGTVEVWSRPLSDGSTALAVFNKGRRSADVPLDFARLGLGRPTRILDCWTLGEMSPTLESIHVPGHGAQMLRVWSSR